MRRLLTEASVIAEASAAGLQEKTSSGKTGSKEPTTAGVSTQDQVRAMFERAVTDIDKAIAITKAERLISRTKRLPPRPMTSDEREFWATERLNGGMGRDYRTVAKEAGLSEKEVWKARQKAGLDPRYGTPLERKPEDEAA